MIEKNNNKNPNIYSFNYQTVYYLPPNNQPSFPPIQNDMFHNFLDQNIYFHTPFDQTFLNYPPNYYLNSVPQPETNLVYQNNFNFHAPANLINNLQPDFLYHPANNTSQNFIFDPFQGNRPSFSNRIKPKLDTEDSDQLPSPVKKKRRRCNSYRRASTVSLEEIWNAANPSPNLQRNQTETAKALEVNRSSLWRNLTEKGINFYGLIGMDLGDARLKYGIYFTKPLSQHPKKSNNQEQKNNKKQELSEACLDEDSKKQSKAPKLNKKRKFSEAFFDQPEPVKNKDDEPLVQGKSQDQLLTNSDTHNLQSTDSFFGHQYKTDFDQNKTAYPKKQKVSKPILNNYLPDNHEFPDDNLDDLLNQDLFSFLKY